MCTLLNGAADAMNGLMGGGSSGTAPSVPSAGQSFGEFNQDYARYADLYASNLASDQQTHLDISREYSPKQVQQALDLERQFYPQAMQLQLAERTQEAQDAAALQPYLAATEDPATRRIRETLASQYEQELAAGSSMTPEMAREVEQAIRSAQSSRGLTRGGSAVSGEALYKGAAGQALRSQRQSAAENFLKTQTATTINPYTALTGRQAAMQTTPTGVNPSFSGISNLAGQGMNAQSQAATANAQLGFNWAQFQQSQQITAKDLLGMGTQLGGAAMMGGM